MDDTTPEMRAMQARLLADATVAQRAQIAFRLSATVRRLSRRAVRRAHPELSEQDADLLWFELHYGGALASAVRARLRAQP